MSEDIMNINEEIEYEEDPKLLLTLDDGSEVSCVVLSIFEIGEQQYIALLPDSEEDEDAEEMDVYIYRFAEDEEGNPLLDNIEDDDEYNEAVEVFNSLFEEEEAE